MVPVGYRETSNSFLKSYIFVGTGWHETPTPEAEFHVPSEWRSPVVSQLFSEAYQRPKIILAYLPS